MNESEQTKQHARTAALAARDGIPEDERERRSVLACEELEKRLATHLKPNALVAVYAAMKSEASVNPFVSCAFQHGWHVCFPCMVKGEGSRPAPTIEAGAAACPGADTGGTTTPEHSHTPRPRPSSKPGSSRSVMEFCLVNHQQFENPGETFLAHPLRSFTRKELAQAGFALAEPEEIDAVVAPLVAFDDSGNRLGYGGGNYDRLLARLRPDATIVGVAFEEQRLEHLPIEPHDRALPAIVIA